MRRSIRRFRQRAHARQCGRCFYCQVPMWCRNPALFAQRYYISLAIARRFQCTAEHLIPVSQGGRDEADNIVAACLFCNQTRHRAKSVRESGDYASYVRKRVAANRWHSGDLLVRNPKSDIRNDHIVGSTETLIDA